MIKPLSAMVQKRAPAAARITLNPAETAVGQAGRGGAAAVSPEVQPGGIR
ncbi:MAG: hypothetical protein KDA37_03065 [Planctomycetales bacterium]|nr:hypothetical protein [Planctomycetales bacterium]